MTSMTRPSSGLVVVGNPTLDAARKIRIPLRVVAVCDLAEDGRPRGWVAQLGQIGFRNRCDEHRLDRGRGCICESCNRRARRHSRHVVTIGGRLTGTASVETVTPTQVRRTGVVRQPIVAQGGVAQVVRVVAQVVGGQVFVEVAIVRAREVVKIIGLGGSVSLC